MSNAEWDMSQHSDDHVQTASGLGEPLLGGESKVGKEKKNLYKPILVNMGGCPPGFGKLHYLLSKYYIC